MFYCMFYFTCDRSLRVCTISSTHGVKTEQNEQWDGRQPSTFPLVQRHRAIGVVVDLNHHVLKYLHTASVSTAHR